MKPIVHTEPLSETYAALLFPYLQDPALYEYIPGAPPARAEALAAEFRRLSAGSPRETERWLNWVAFHEAQPVGTLQATIYADRTAVIGYTVFRAFWRRSFGSQGCRWVLRELFAQHGVTRVHAFVDERNVPSIKLLSSVGFQPGAPDNVADVPVGDRVFVLSASDWRRLPSSEEDSP